MDEIVGERARPWPDKIGKHRKIGRKEQNDKRQPREASVTVKRNRCSKGGGSLEAQDRPDPARGRPGGARGSRCGGMAGVGEDRRHRGLLQRRRSRNRFMPSRYALADICVMAYLSGSATRCSMI